MKNLSTKIGGAILTLAFIFGISAVSAMTAQAQYRDRNAQRQDRDDDRRADNQAQNRDWRRDRDRDRDRRDDRWRRNDGNYGRYGNNGNYGRYGN
ncbi:MAG: hypothetical protein DMF73_02340, partial [Acidobacteria bacterium]